MRASHRAWLALAILVVTGALLFVWNANQDRDRSAAGPAASKVTPSSAPTPPAVSTTPIVVAFDPDKPRRGLPSPGPVDELAARAGAGDAIAACQLAAELSTCRVNETLRVSGSRDPEHAPTPRCDTLLATHRDRHFEWLRQAAHAGEPEAMLRYASGEAFGVHGGSFDYLRSPQFDIWRREAPTMLEALLDAGHPEAVMVRMLASQPMMGGPLYTVLEPDRLQDLAYADLSLRLQRGIPNLPLNRRAGADPAFQQQVRDLAARWHQERFQGRTYDFEALLEDDGFPIMRESGVHCSMPVGGEAP